MKERLKKYCRIEGMQVSTIHSMCVRIMKSFIQYTPLKLPFSIYDDSDQQTVIKTLLKARSMDDDPWNILSTISRMKGDPDYQILDDNVREIKDAYQEILIKNNACDFDDILIYALQCLGHSDCKTFYNDLWRHVLIDEFQDTSVIQYDILKKLYDSSKTSTLFVIGDLNQSIYSWRGARPDNIQDFINTFKPTQCHLTYNYRSCSDVITFANKFLQYGKPMVVKSSNKGMISMSIFKSYEDESERVADAIQKMGNYEETAIIYRVNARSMLFERALAKRRVPYKVYGDLPFYKRRIVKDLLSYCKAAVNESDMESLIRIVNTPKRGFGEAKQEQLMRTGRGFLSEISMEMPQMGAFLDLLGDIKDKAPAQALPMVVDRVRYPLDKEGDRELVETLINVASGFSTLDELILASTFLEEDSGKGVKLMTAHASKGLEFDRVFVVGIEDGLWPHQLCTNVAEEQRLFYVAVTRARRYLNLSYSQSRMYRGNSLTLKPSSLYEKSRGAFG